MDHKYRKEYGCLILRMPAELDHHAAEFLKEEADGLILKYPVRSLVFDFSDTRFMDSSGIGVIMGRYQKMNYLGGEVAAIHVNKRIRRIFQLSGLYKIVHIIEENVTVQEHRREFS